MGRNKVTNLRKAIKGYLEGLNYNWSHIVLLGGLKFSVIAVYIVTRHYIKKGKYLYI